MEIIMPMVIVLCLLQIAGNIAADGNWKYLKREKKKKKHELKIASLRQSGECRIFTKVTTIQNGPYKSGLGPIFCFK